MWTWLRARWARREVRRAFCQVCESRLIDPTVVGRFCSEECREEYLVSMAV